MPPRAVKFDPETQEHLARRLRSLHGTPPLLLINVWDASLAKAVAALPDTQALASASFCIAEASGVPDAELDFATNLRAITAIGAVAQEHDLPFTADSQHGYGEDLEVFFERAIREAGIVGCNIEDLLPDESGLISVEEATSRIRRVRAVAEKMGVPSFVINARVDVLNRPNGTLETAKERGLKYLDAGADTAFVWRKGPGLESFEIEMLVQALPEGKFNTQARKGGLSVKEISELGVGRISIGPGLFHEVNALITKRAKELINGGVVL